MRKMKTRYSKNKIHVYLEGSEICYFDYTRFINDSDHKFAKSKADQEICDWMTVLGDLYEFSDSLMELEVPPLSEDEEDKFCRMMYKAYTTKIVPNCKAMKQNNRSNKSNKSGIYSPKGEPTKFGEPMCT